MFCSSATLQRQILKLPIVRLDQVGKSGAEPVVVGADQGVQAHQVDVVLDDDQVALVEQRIQPAGGVGDDQAAGSPAPSSPGSERSPARANNLRKGETALPSR